MLQMCLCDRSRTFVGLLIMVVFGSGADGQESADTKMIRPAGEIEAIHEGFQFTEGPAWDPSGVMYFTDLAANTIHRLASDGKISSFTTDSKTANGLVFTKAGRLLACQMTGRVVSYDVETRKETVLADSYDGKRFNAPNDLVIDSSGGIYFTDPLFRAPTPLPQEVQAVYYRSAGGDVSRVTGHIASPNGVALSPRGDRLYVVPTYQAEVLVYDVDGPGKISNGRTLCRLRQPTGQSGTGGDGMAVDVEGNLYITSSLGVEIFSSDGEHRGLVEFPQQPANVGFGGPQRKTMYVTARTGLYRVEMPIAGLSSN